RYQSLVERSKEASSFLNRLKDGFSYLKENPLILLFGAISGFVFASILVCSFFTMPIFINLYMHGNEGAYGITEASFAFGSLLSGFLILSIFPKNKLTLGIICLSFLAGLMYLFIGYNTELVYLYLAYGFIGFANAGIRVMRTTYIFRVIPNQVVGRTGSVFMVINTLFRIIFIGLFSLSYFSEAANISKTMFILAIFVILGGLILLLNFKKLSGLNANYHD
ncbi:MAG: MFS transporter, partial [Bacteroidetes bacterium]|nr:MFS transporter [Bacteroidota bacterium]